MRIIVSAVLFILLFILEKVGVLHFLEGKWYAFIPWLIPYIIIGYDILIKAFKNITHGDVFDENFLMLIATIGAFAVSEAEEGVAVMLLYQVGELFQSVAVQKSRNSISDLMNIVPDFANLLKDDEIEEVDPEDVHTGDIIVIKPGERVPLDGIILSGDSFLDTSSLTGESVPRRVKENDEVISGCINTKGTLRVRVTKEYEDSTVSKILELVENASSRKAQTENFITRFARVYTPVVTIAAVLLAVVPPLIFGFIMGNGFLFSEWIRRACTFLVISCPCALVISVPLGFFAGIGASSKIGVLVKGSNFLEALSDVKTIVFDKTGTLTKGTFKVTEVNETEGISKESLLEIAAHAEYFSTHPIALALKNAYEEEIIPSRIKNTEEIAGHGIVAVIDETKYFVGNMKLMNQAGVEALEETQSGTVIYIAKSGSFLGSIVISDEVKDGIKDALISMKKAGIEKTVMLTGDRMEVAKVLAEDLHIDEVHADLLPQDKVMELEKILSSEKGKEKTAFVGDGINDAPVLVRADVGIAMGSLGSDAAIEAADIVLMDDDVRKISKTVQIARKTLRIVRQNIVFALLIKGIVLILGALGIANMWLAVFADVGVAVLAILNSMRAMKVEK